jgi:predicted ATP-dependent protease
VNLERQVKMSGRIHSKGVLILSGYLGHRYAQDKAFSLSASICFEQLYEEVEGDSASSAELYCLLSSLSEAALRQDIAVTGSVDQRGRIQPVGAINEKIEGFYAVCKAKGLTGSQGVMIPKTNARHLMLKEEVVTAVRNKKFHIYPVETIDEGIEILTGVEAGKINPEGKYPQGSINYLVNQKLAEYAGVLSESPKAKS